MIEICKRLGPSVRSFVCCLDQEGEWASELADLGVPVVALNRRPGFRPSLALRIRGLARRFDVQAIHCHHYSPYVYGALATVLTRRLGLVFTEHGRLSDSAPSAKRRAANRWLTRLPGQICAVSAALKEHMLLEGFREDRVRVVYNGIEVPPVIGEADRVAARQMLGIPSRAFVVGAVGRLDPVKNLPALLEAHRLAMRTQTDARLVIVGDGPERVRLSALASSLGTVDAVKFVGYRADVRRLLPALDVFVNCSTYEGVSLTILEAMAAGLPVVATHVGGNPEVVLDDETGVLVPAKTVAPLADAISALASDPDRRRKLGDAGRHRVEGHFSIERMVEDYFRAYVESCRFG